MDRDFFLELMREALQTLPEITAAAGATSDSTSATSHSQTLSTDAASSTSQGVLPREPVQPQIIYNQNVYNQNVHNQPIFSGSIFTRSPGAPSDNYFSQNVTPQTTSTSIYNATVYNGSSHSQTTHNVPAQDGLPFNMFPVQLPLPASPPNKTIPKPPVLDPSELKFDAIRALIKEGHDPDRINMILYQSSSEGLATAGNYIQALLSEGTYSQPKVATPQVPEPSAQAISQEPRRQGRPCKVAPAAPGVASALANQPSSSQLPAQSAAATSYGPRRRGRPRKVAPVATDGSDLSNQPSLSQPTITSSHGLRHRGRHPKEPPAISNTASSSVNHPVSFQPSSQPTSTTGQGPRRRGRPRKIHAVTPDAAPGLTNQETTFQISTQPTFPTVASDSINQPVVLSSQSSVPTNNSLMPASTGSRKRNIDSVDEDLPQPLPIRNIRPRHQDTTTSRPPCGLPISKSELSKHLRDFHGFPHLSERIELYRCPWNGCQNEVQGRSLPYHIRMVHQRSDHQGKCQIVRELEAVVKHRERNHADVGSADIVSPSLGSIAGPSTSGAGSEIPPFAAGGSSFKTLGAEFSQMQGSADLANFDWPWEEGDGWEGIFH